MLPTVHYTNPDTVNDPLETHDHTMTVDQQLGPSPCEITHHMLQGPQLCSHRIVASAILPAYRVLGVALSDKDPQPARRINGQCACLQAPSVAIKT